MPLGQRPGDNGESRYAGRELEYDSDIQLSLSSSLGGGFDFIVAPLTDPSYRPSQQPTDAFGGSFSPPFAGSDLVLSPSQWSSHVVGKISPWIDLDSPEAVLRSDSESTLKQELSWASHLSLQACLLPLPKALDCGNYARCVNQSLQGLTTMHLWLRIPIVAPQLEAAEGTAAEDELYLKRDLNTGRFLHDPWEWWHAFRTLCEHHSQLCVALDLRSSLPPPGALARWLGEPVKAAILHTTAFLTNKRGYPCLSRRHQTLLRLLFNHSVQIVVTGPSAHPVEGLEGPATSDCSGNGNETAADSSAAHHALRPYLEYVAHLYRKMDPLTEQDKFEPLMDNLEAQTYETFEKDATKYVQYQQAVHAALLDRVPDDLAESTVVVLMVVGAGRGPLVRASLQASVEAGRQLRVYAVEKNPNAVVTLHALVAAEGWKDVVTIVSCDMRHWKAPEQADILVSELLGSFGDNELSPECLDGAQRFLKSDGISIPSAYTSFIAPMSASKLHNDVRAYNDLAHFETAYVVKLHCVDPLCAPQPVFTFVHPNREEVVDNRRYTRLLFELPPDTGSCVVHGFGGYFDAVLYGDVHLGIEPASATPNMFSWFPIFFPLRHPMHILAGSKVELHFWRCLGPTKVWYEWAVTAPSLSPVHNPNGRSYWVGL